MYVINAGVSLKEREQSFELKVTSQVQSNRSKFEELDSLRSELAQEKSCRQAGQAEVRPFSDFFPSLVFLLGFLFSSNSACVCFFVAFFQF